MITEKKQMQIKPKNNKILFFSDLHLGTHQNSQTWHKICLMLADWICTVMKQHELDTIIIAGDVFHDRHEIGVNTLYAAKLFFDKLSEFQIHIIPGNHDAFLSTNAEINSVEILTQSNIHVYSNVTTVNINNKTLTFCPWKTKLEELERVDMLVGHFDISNFRVTYNKVCDHGETPEQFLDKATHVVTGHFHYRDHRIYNNGEYILYLGSPYEMDFGDRDQDKGVTIINFNDLSDVTFIKNEITPKHYRVKISDLLQKKYGNLPQLIKNNIISLYVDTKIDTLTLDMLISKLIQYEPLQFRTEFNILDSAQIDTREVQKLSIDVETAFHEFIEHVETRATKKEVLDKCLDLYKLCQMSYE
jgi:DNA repair exonuclease SbcCD nuclease subunit